MDWSPIRDAVEAATGTPVHEAPHAIAGGCINQAFRLGDLFVKLNTPACAPMFEAELLALDALRATATVHVPRPICSGTTTEHSFLALEFLPLTSRSPRCEVALGHQLAALHRVTDARFGWTHDNVIGTTLQPNPPSDSWITFFREQRLAPMFRLAETRGLTFRGANRLLDTLDRFFPSGDPPSSLLHGDLWTGNAAALPDDTPVVFDPATYFGDRETDLAMTFLFGGFSPRFYASYEEAWPLPPGWEPRRDLYALYHVLNHAILFGGAYPSQAEGMITALLT